MGVVSAVLAFVGFNGMVSGWAGTSSAEWLGLAMYMLIIAYFIWHSRRAKIGE